ncbi:class I SAM-dependent methyltransferase [Allorhizocola rhizosphaerae]|uniref:class I SAM-dependent methyltransferase n=1 Tax=Allorhizocola rhizosphaerae TaxID=1872709 RepID=UPI000E3D8221|nr:class I SAM-dependent methyltransferase [Allorhizocola rhizosphaerae]
MSANPFLEPGLAAALYGDADRLTARTSALRRAKIAGADAAETICDLLDGMIRPDSVVLDVGCGRGTTSIALARRFRLRNLTAFDLSGALLQDAANRFAAVGLDIATRQGDFHDLPFAASTLDAVVAAFCLYHSTHPGRAIGEISRCLRRSGVAVLVTKSADSYIELDDVVAASGLDPHAHTRPSLYNAFHSANIRSLATEHLTVVRIVEQRHVFRFHDFAHLAAYLATTPRYHIGGTVPEITARLRAWQPDTPVTASSTVSYLVGTKP